MAPDQKETASQWEKYTNLNFFSARWKNSREIVEEITDFCGPLTL